LKPGPAMILSLDKNPLMTSPFPCFDPPTYL
jgi:hypothetical protein